MLRNIMIETQAGVTYDSSINNTVDCQNYSKPTISCIRLFIQAHRCMSNQLFVMQIN